MKEVPKEEVSDVSGGAQLPREPASGISIPGMPAPGFPQVPCFPDITDPTTIRPTKTREY